MVEYIYFTSFLFVSATANMEVDGLADELHRQKEECRKQHEELAILASKLQYAESQINKVSNVVLRQLGLYVRTESKYKYFMWACFETTYSTQLT